MLEIALPGDANISPIDHTTTFIICPGSVESINDGDAHYINALKLAKLYGVPLAACCVLAAAPGPLIMHEVGSNSWRQFVLYINNWVVQNMLYKCPIRLLMPSYEGNYDVQNAVQIIVTPTEADVVVSLKTTLPGLADATAKCPLSCYVAHQPLTRIIIHLNDTHKWTREQIADWLETLDVDLSFSLC